MRSIPQLLLAGLLFFGSATCFAADDLAIASGTVAKAEKNSLSVVTSDKRKLELKVTGTSTFKILSPQVRKGKTIVMQRGAEIGDLVPGQAIAVIYTVADKENVVLSAILKPADKEKE